MRPTRPPPGTEAAICLLLDGTLLSRYTVPSGRHFPLSWDEYEKGPFFFNGRGRGREWNWSLSQLIFLLLGAGFLVGVLLANVIRTDVFVSDM